MLNSVMRALAHVALLVTLTAMPILVQAASNIGDQANLKAVLLNGEKVNIENWKGKVALKQVGRMSEEFLRQTVDNLLAR